MKKMRIALIAASCGFGLASAAELNIVSWGGAYTESQTKAYHEPFTQKTGIKINNIEQGSAAPAGITSQVRSGTVTWDLVDVLEGASSKMCDEGLVEKIDYDSIIAKGADGSLPSKDWVAGLNGCFVPSIVYATVFAYNNKTFPKGGPKTIKDIFDLKKFPGKRGLEKLADNNLEWALIADGVAIKDVYKVLSTPAGVDRAFKKLDTIKSSVVWWSAGAQPPQLLADKEVAISTGYNGRFFSAQVNDKQPVTIMWDGQSVEMDGWVVPKGKLTKEVKDYLYFATDSQRLADQAKYISYGPARQSSGKLVSKHALTGVDMAPHMPTAKANYFNPLVKSASFWADNGEALNQRFQAWLAK